MAYNKTLEYTKLNEEELNRVTEINFSRVINKLIEKTGSLATAEPYIRLIAMSSGIAPHYLMSLVERAYREPVPPSDDELIEIYYRSNYTRKYILSVVKVRADNISRVMRDDFSSILPCSFEETELKFMKMLILFFSEIGEAIM